MWPIRIKSGPATRTRKFSCQEWRTSCKSGSRADATSKMECFVIIVSGWKPLTIITKHSILDVAAALDPPLIFAVWLKTWILEIHYDTISSKYFFLNATTVPETDPRHLLPEFIIFTLVFLKISFPSTCVPNSVISHEFVGSGK